ncbi:MAG: hypothetical protein PHQ72_08735 [Hespellia sp.]|nr:hypothetical protein [Hespellia sp.]
MNKKNMYSTPVIVLAIIGACFAVIGNIAAIGSSVYRIVAVSREVSLYGDDHGTDAWYDDYDSYEDGDAEEYTEEDLKGVDPSTEALTGIESYEEEGTTVTVKSDSYSLYREAGDGGEIYFDVQYPVISGTDETLTETINQKIQGVAMVSADKYYLDVQGRSQIKAGEYGTYIVSEVTYNITYLSNDFISVVFEDNYCKGDYNMHYIDMRSCNIDLKTGTVYDLGQTVSDQNDLAEDFQEELDDKYQTNEVIYGIDTAEYADMITGEPGPDDSFMGFYRTKDGVELFVTFHYITDDGYSVGWLTAPYSMDHIKDYQNDSTFWTILGQSE